LSLQHKTVIPANAGIQVVHLIALKNNQVNDLDWMPLTA